VDAVADTAGIISDFDGIAGMTGEMSARVFIALLEQQGARGDILETGAYKGKSAIVLANLLRDGEVLDLVDVEDYLEKQHFERFGQSVRFFVGNADDLKTLLPHFEKKRGGYRFVHSDASHTFDNVLNDLVYADALLNEEGLASVDDYENGNFPQVPFAVGAALFKKRVRLTPFLVTNNKLYLCRPSQQQRMLKFVVNQMAPQFYEQFKMVLVRTDTHAMAPLTLRHPNTADEGPVFAPEFYAPWIDLLRQ
jgi:hypothetical protein